MATAPDPSAPAAAAGVPCPRYPLDTASQCRISALRVELDHRNGQISSEMYRFAQTQIQQRAKTLGMADPFDWNWTSPTVRNCIIKETP